MAHPHQNAADTALSPRLAGGIGAWELFSGTHIVGIRELHRYVRVPSALVPVVLDAAKWMDGKRELDEIASLLLDSGYKVDVRDLCERFRRAGLIEGSVQESELGRFSISWRSIPLAWLFPPSHSWQRWYRAAAILALLAVLVACVILPTGIVTFARLVDGPRAPGWVAALMVTTGVAVSVAIHEGGHALAAAAAGLRPESLRVLGYFGFIPYFMLVIPGLYTLPPRKRIEIWAAGPVSSLAFASVAAALSAIPALESSHAWLLRLATLNAMIALGNCLPMLPTDGNLILLTLLRRHDPWARSWREVAALVRGPRRPRIALLLYAGASAVLIAALAGHNILHVLRWSGYSLAGCAAASLIATVLVGKWILRARGQRESRRNGLRGI